MSFKSWLRQKLSDDMPAKELPPDRNLPEVEAPPMPPIAEAAPAPKKPRKPRKPRAKKPPTPAEAPPVSSEENPAKLEATAKGEPWVNVTGIEVDLDNLGSGSFTLDFNEIFVAKLIRAGYKGKTDFDVVDQWFTDVCRNVAQENYEQLMADPTNRNQS